MNEETKKNLLDILNNTRFITIATICEDGMPWATPLGWFAFDGENIVFDNRAGTVHAKNLKRDGRCFISVVNYDQEHSRAVYVETFAEELVGNDYDLAKKLIEDKGLRVSDGIAFAPIGKVNMEKSRIIDESGKKRFYCYMKAGKK